LRFRVFTATIPFVANAELFQDVNPHFAAMKPDGMEVSSQTIPIPFGIPECRIEDGIFYSYSPDELRAVGNGSVDKGHDEVYNYIMEDPRSLLEMAVDPDRPFDELLSEVQVERRSKVRFVFAVSSYSEPPMPLSQMWDLGFPGVHPMVTKA
jgi:hypothetical protein